MDEPRLVPWYPCEYPERPYVMGETLLCGTPCPACLIVAEIELNKLDPLTEDPRNLESWHYIVGMLVGDSAGYGGVDG